MNMNQDPQFKFIQALVTTLRQFAIYPPGHPSIANSIKSALSALNLLFIDKEKLNVGISPDKSLFLEGKAVSAKEMPVAADFAVLFERLGVEELIFSKGISEEELSVFIGLMAAPKAAETLRGADINMLFGERAIRHITARQFSYLKVEKGREPVIPTEDVSERLKARVKALCDGSAGGQERGQLEKEIFSLIGDELKAKGKLSAVSRNTLRKYLQHARQEEETLARLREVLAECGVGQDVVEEAVKKLTAESSPRARKTPSGMEAENAGLKAQVEDLRRRLAEKELRIARLEQESKRAVDEKHRIDNIIHNLAEGMVVVDASGKILLANTAAENLLGITSQDVGRQVQDVVRDEHLLTMAKGAPADSENVVEKDIEFYSPNDTTRKVLRASSAVVEDNNGNTIGMVTMLNDVTRQKELEKMKSDFLSNVSHELRTPLVAIEKSVSLMLQKQAGEISETQGQFLSIAERNLKRLTFLINDLLDLSRLESGKMELKPEKTDLERLIGDCLETLTGWAGTKSLKLERKFGKDLTSAWADPNRLSQVLVNLVGNAIKFTPPGGAITVSVARESAGEDLLVTVSDTGVGIAPGELKQIFDKFYQARDRASSDITGTGIGLAIVKEIITLHRGRVWAESDGANGARFIFTLKRWDDTLAQAKEEKDG